MSSSVHLARLSSLALLALLVVSAAALPASQAWAQQGGEAKKDAPVRAGNVKLKLDGEDVVIVKGDGWVIGKAPKGAVALLRSAGEGESQMDVRYSPNISIDQRDTHLSTFHTNIKSMGLKEVSSRSVDLSSGAFPKVEETIYELTANKKPYRLVVWHVHRKQAVWVFTLFEPLNGAESTDPLSELVTRVELS